MLDGYFILFILFYSLCYFTADVKVQNTLINLPDGIKRTLSTSDESVLSEQELHVFYLFLIFFLILFHYVLFYFSHFIV
jgi:hypothetical protein